MANEKQWDQAISVVRKQWGTGTLYRPENGGQHCALGALGRVNRVPLEQMRYHSCFDSQLDEKPRLRSMVRTLAEVLREQYPESIEEDDQDMVAWFNDEHNRDQLIAMMEKARAHDESTPLG